MAEQVGPPSEVERVTRDIEWVRRSQLRFKEGYHARMAEPHPMRKNAKGEALNTREQKWSFADMAATKCPGAETQVANIGGVQCEVGSAWPAHERERWIAGFLHADGIAAERGVAAMERADPARMPPRPKKVSLAIQEDGFIEEAPLLTRAEAKAWWDRHRGTSSGYNYQDAGEQT